MNCEKICLICKKAKIECWESACKKCWDGLNTKEKKYLTMLNHIREALRSCGKDFEDVGGMW